jgi:hypothetical protein
MNNRSQTAIVTMFVLYVKVLYCIVLSVLEPDMDWYESRSDAFV